MRELDPMLVEVIDVAKRVECKRIIAIVKEVEALGVPSEGWDRFQLIAYESVCRQILMRIDVEEAVE